MINIVFKCGPSLLRGILLILICCPLATAQNARPSKGQISVTQILDKYLEATGGLDARRKLGSIEIHGSVTQPPTFQNMGHDFDFYSKASSSDLFKLETRSHGMASVGHNAGRPFRTASAGGIGMLNGISVEIMEQNLSLLIESDWQHYSKIDLVGVAVVEGRWTYVVRFTPKQGDSQLRYYDSENFMMMRIDHAQRTRPQERGPDGAYMIETYFSKYAETAGLKFPKRIEYRCSDGDLRLTLEHIKANVPIDDSIFEKKRD